MNLLFICKDEFLQSPAAAHTDGVVVATSHSAHAEIGLKALGAGFHVFMEKPMTTDPAEASSLAKAAADQDKVFLVNNTANFRDSAEQVREVVKGPSACSPMCRGICEQSRQARLPHDAAL